MTSSHYTLNTSDLEASAREWAQGNVPGSSLAEAEQQIEEKVRRLRQVMMEEVGKKMGGRETYEGSTIACECGERARFVGYRRRWIQTLCGEIEVTRAYYHCRGCGRGHLPWDVRQGLNGRQCSPGVKALACELSARLHYSEASAVMERLRGIRIEESSLEGIVGEVGGRLREAERAQIAGVLEGGEEVEARKKSKRLYVSMDGVMAHIDKAWHEVKAGAVYEGAPIGSGEHPDRDCKRWGLYTACREAPEEFGNRLYLLALRGGLEEAEEVVVMGDGAPWIWSQASIHFQGGKGGYTEVVDYRHACEHIYELARVLYGEASEQGKRWAKGHCDTLEENGPERLIRALKRRKAKDEEQRAALARELNYFQKNRKRMDYPGFRARGLMIGSGPVEAACKVVVGQRLKQAGMRWSDRGADAVLAIRTTVLNGDLDELAAMARAA